MKRKTIRKRKITHAPRNAEVAARHGGGGGGRERQPRACVVGPRAGTAPPRMRGGEDGERGSAHARRARGWDFVPGIPVFPPKYGFFAQKYPFFPLNVAFSSKNTWFSPESGVFSQKYLFFPQNMAFSPRNIYGGAKRRGAGRDTL